MKTVNTAAYHVIIWLQRPFQTYTLANPPQDHLRVHLKSKYLFTGGEYTERNEFSDRLRLSELNIFDLI